MKTILTLITCLVFLDSAFALSLGEANGSLVINGKAVLLTAAASVKTEGLFDNAKEDTIITLSDRPLGSLSPSDEIGISLKARTGELTAIALRFDGSKLVNAKLFYEKLSGEIILPGQWFEAASKGADEGKIKLPKRETDGQTFECIAEFSAVRAANTPVPTPEPTLAPIPPTPTLPQATTLNDANYLTPLFIAAIMKKDEAEALKLIKLGLNPDGRDQYGVPVLNWSVMMCMPKVVQALVNKNASLTYARSPGMTILTEAGACPEAEKILRAAGAK